MGIEETMNAAPGYIKRDEVKGWRADCFRTSIATFDAAYKKACESSQPDDWMHAALLAQQFRNVAYAVLTGEAPQQQSPREEAHSWRAVAERLETEMQDLLHVCDCEIRDQTNNRTASDKQSAAYAEGALRVAKGIARRIRAKALTDD